ncbi:hypothetical protein M3P05_15620 [Sansalvadorimonas sp. 2012CJ34-2]|uniref:Uncharacterized protein n=1 Tax=Parendozoicomonas callyspongiae TaxID=2942213 RepID=A0ABT0PJ25_9GAMM|nr:hypothetical protein [Sansalvadorimonas sp. 2012CJ34-2]MCL6271349.1 hypothetical protein [Sansalvadorimonas sp. 2012CJ34-2]
MSLPPGQPPQFMPGPYPSHGYGAVRPPSAGTGMGFGGQPGLQPLLGEREAYNYPPSQYIPQPQPQQPYYGDYGYSPYSQGGGNFAHPSMVTMPPAPSHRLDFAAIRVDMGTMLKKQKLQEALISAGRKRLALKGKCLVQLCMANVYGLVSSLKGKDGENVIDEQGLAQLRPASNKVVDRVKSLKALEDVLKTKFHSQDQSAEVFMLLVLGQMLILGDKQKCNPNQMLLNDLLKDLQSANFSLDATTPEGMGNQKLVLERMVELDLHLSPAAAEYIPILDIALRNNLVIFNVDVDDYDGALERFASDVVATYEPVAYREYYKQQFKFEMQRLVANANSPKLSDMLMAVRQLQAQGHYGENLVYTCIKAVISAPAANLSDLFEGQGFEINADDLKELGQLLNNTETETETRKALGAFINQLKDTERQVCLEVLIQEMGFVPESESKSENKQEEHTSSSMPFQGRPEKNVLESPPVVTPTIECPPNTELSVFLAFMGKIKTAYSSRGSIKAFIEGLVSESLVSEDLGDRCLALSFANTPSNEDRAGMLLSYIKRKLTKKTDPDGKSFDLFMDILKKEAAWSATYKNMQAQREKGVSAEQIIKKNQTVLISMFSSNLNTVVTGCKERQLLTIEEQRTLTNPQGSSYDFIRDESLLELESMLEESPDQLFKIMEVMINSGVSHHERLAGDIKKEVEKLTQV